MRVISERGEYDIPYELSVFWRDENIIWANAFGTVKIIFAQYSSADKAEKAMLLLHKIYVKAPLENDAKEMGEFVYGTYKAIGNSGYVEPESSCFVFRFPTEDEL